MYVYITWIQFCVYVYETIVLKTCFWLAFILTGDIIML